jgi:hypothetical protein
MLNSTMHVEWASSPSVYISADRLLTSDNYMR